MSDLVFTCLVVFYQNPGSSAHGISSVLLSIQSLMSDKPASIGIFFFFFPSKKGDSDRPAFS